MPDALTMSWSKSGPMYFGSLLHLTILTDYGILQWTIIHLSNYSSEVLNIFNCIITFI